MLQVVQYQKNGEMLVVDVPMPECPQNGVLVRTHFSLISAGTEKVSVTNAQGNLIERAKKQPDQVKLVIDTVKKQGLVETANRVLSKLDSYKPLGYSLAGVVVQSKSSNFKPGDRVSCAGAGYANHAEFVTIPQNLVAHIPENVSFKEAVYTTVASIGLHGIRQADLRLGEIAVVIGLGLIGQMTVQMLKASGCRVIGVDISEKALSKAREFGADLTLLAGKDAVEGVMAFTGGVGADAVIITAGSDSDKPLQEAMEMSRQRGTVVIVGAVGMNLQRQPFYKKEVNLKISSSYGPGRYDAFYEEYGIDYPIAYARWTENRNMKAILDLLSQKKINFNALTTHTFNVNQAPEAYKMITEQGGQQDFLGVLIEYPESENSFDIPIYTTYGNVKGLGSKIKVGFVGLGQFAQNYLLPPIVRFGVELSAVSTANPINAASLAKSKGFGKAYSIADELINSEESNVIFCATRHDTHSKYVLDALRNNKPIFVEKPLCVNREQLNEISEALEDKSLQLMVGFNRRFSAPFMDINKFFSDRKEPMTISYRVNAGFIDPAHWVHSLENGGRIIGEGCHFIDTMSFLTKAKPISVLAQSISSDSEKVINNDSVFCLIKFDDGSIGQLAYLANGAKSISKEYCEVFCGGKTAIMNDFKTVDFYSSSIKSKKYKGEKGINNEVDEFLKSVSDGKPSPISFDSIYRTTLTTFAILKSLETGQVISLDEF